MLLTRMFPHLLMEDELPVILPGKLPGVSAHGRPTNSNYLKLYNHINSIMLVPNPDFVFYCSKRLKYFSRYRVNQRLKMFVET